MIYEELDLSIGVLGKTRIGEDLGNLEAKEN